MNVIHSEHLSQGSFVVTLLRSRAFPEQDSFRRRSYYVYQGDMVRGVEDLRTPLREILHLERQIRGTIAGFMTPQFVVDLPGGGGNRLAASYETYDQTKGVATFVAPGVNGSERIF